MKFMKLLLISIVVFSGVAHAKNNRSRRTTENSQETITPIKNIKDLKKVIQKAKEQNKPLILKVFLQHCPACISVKESFEEVAKSFSKEIVFAEINADIQTNGEFMLMFKISGVPTFMVIQKEQLSLPLSELKKVVVKKTGALSSESLTKIAQDSLAA